MSMSFVDAVRFLGYESLAEADAAYRRSPDARLLIDRLIGAAPAEPTQRGRRMNARLRREVRRKAHFDGVDAVRRERPHGAERGRVKLVWADRLTDGQDHMVSRYRLVDGKRVPIVTEDTQRAKAERVRRAKAYQRNGWAH